MILNHASISPTITHHKYAQQTETLGDTTLSVSIEEAKEELPVYDNISDQAIYRKIASAQRAIEDYVNIDTTIRTRRSLWLTPQRVIELPYGVHEILTVEQQLHPGDAFAPIENYRVLGLEFKSLVLELLYPTRVTYVSGKIPVDDILREAILKEVSYYFKNRNDPNEVAPATLNGLSMITVNLLANHRR